MAQLRRNESCGFGDSFFVRRETFAPALRGPGDVANVAVLKNRPGRSVFRDEQHRLGQFDGADNPRRQKSVEQGCEGLNPSFKLLPGRGTGRMDVARPKMPGLRVAQTGQRVLRFALDAGKQDEALRRRTAPPPLRKQKRKFSLMPPIVRAAATA